MASRCRRLAREVRTRAVSRASREIRSDMSRSTYSRRRSSAATRLIASAVAGTKTIVVQKKGAPRPSNESTSSTTPEAAAPAPAYASMRTPKRTPVMSPEGHSRVTSHETISRVPPPIRTFITAKKGPMRSSRKGSASNSMTMTRSTGDAGRICAVSKRARSRRGKAVDGGVRTAASQSSESTSR